MSTAIARNLMAEMKLAGMLAAFDKIVADATRDQVSYSEFLDALLQAEADCRGERAAQRRLKAAKLPIRVCLDDFDYSAHRSIAKAQIREIQSLGWLKDGRPLLLIGQPGVRDRGLLESAMARPQNQFAYGEQSIARLAASYAFGISRNHPFLDGNKRTSLVVAELFLDLNGFELIATDAQCVTTFLQLAAGDLTEDQLADWITAHVAPIARIQRADPASESP